MSKIDGQINDLRKVAQVYRYLGKHATEVMLLDATDTICELRGALQVASREHRGVEEENAKLRELVNILVFCANKERVVGCDGCAINGADMHATVPEWLFCDSMVERLRALGFEVTE